MRTQEINLHCAYISWCYHQEDPTRAHLSWLWVDPEHRGQGYGRILVGQVQRRHPILSVCAVELDPSVGDPTDFYLHLGFELMPGRRGYLTLEGPIT